MTFWSMMMVRVLEGQSEEAAQVWIKNRIVEAAAETCVMCGWEDKAAYEEWRNSPVRAKITNDLSSTVSFDIKTVCFQGIHTVSK